MKKFLYIGGLIGLTLFVLCAVFLLCISAHMKNTVNDRIFSTPDAYNKGRAEAVMVLGAGVSENGTVSYILKDRLDYGIALYKKRFCGKNSDERRPRQSALR